jgi:hypothetical protein
MGRLLSSSVNPRALNRLLWGAWAVPVLTESLLIIISLFLFLIFLYRINVLPGQMASDSLCQKVAHLGTSYPRAALRHAIEAAVKKVLQDGFRTGDIMSEGCTRVGCTEMGDLLAERI